MSRDEISTTINKLLREHLGRDEDPKPTDSLVDDLGADSLDMVELVMAFEEEFDIEISDDAAENMVFVQDVVDYVVKKVGT